MTIDVDQLGLDLGAGIGALLRRFYPLLLREAFRDAEALLELDLAWDVELEEVQEVLDELAVAVAVVAETTRDQIRDLVGRQAQEGWSIPELAREIRALGEVESRRRATLIARTETATAYSKGALLAYERSGVVAQVEWLTAGSEACPICEPLDGQLVDLGKAWGDVAHPPAHPGCRCAIAPVVA